MFRNHRTQTKFALTTFGASALVAASLMGGGPALAQGTDGEVASATTQRAAIGVDLPAIADTWSATWKETSRQQVKHPTLGGLEIRTYFKQTSPEGAAPNTGSTAYAVYQDGRPVGFMSDHGTNGIALSAGPQFSVPDVTFVNSNEDGEGNVYFISGTSVVMLTPTESGYSSNQSLPGDVNKKLSNVKSITIGKDRVAKITAIDENNKTVNYTVKGGKLVPDAA